MFLNARNVIVERMKPDPKVNRKRESKGKNKLPEYHVVRIDKTQIVYEQPNKGTGTKHSHMYPVRGHFRHLKDYPNPIWIPNHFRGISHGVESIPKEIYKVRKSKK
jgi:hypothetical protein